jgi:hypothetical protein
MAGSGESAPWLPGALIVAGLLLVGAGFASDMPDRVGGIVFGLLSWATAGAILYRRAWESRAARRRKGDVVQPDTAPEKRDS